MKRLPLTANWLSRISEGEEEEAEHSKVHEFENPFP